MSNTRRARQPSPKPDLRAGAKLGLLLSARREGCVCANPMVLLDDLDIPNGVIVGRVVHETRACPLFNAGPAAPQNLRAVVADLLDGTT